MPSACIQRLYLAFLNLPGILRSGDLRASFACLVSSETLTGCSSGKKSALIDDAGPDNDWLGEVKFDSEWLGEVNLYDKWCDVSEWVMVWLGDIKVVGDRFEDDEVSVDWFDVFEAAVDWLGVLVDNDRLGFVVLPAE